MQLRQFTPLLVLSLLLACAEPLPVEPTETTQPSDQPELATQLWCEQNPVACNSGGSGDPSPESPGYYFGTSISPDVCISATGAGINDPDYDGLGTNCENALAFSFRPLLISSQYDCNMGMEPYWAAKYFNSPSSNPNDGQVVVRIAYLFGYYEDCGAPANPLEQGVCSLLQAAGSVYLFIEQIPEFDVSGPIVSENICDGHIGDSEFITVDLRYDNVSQHWYTANAYFSSHWGTVGDHSRRTNTSKLEFGDQYGGYPKVYVALGKHANYPSRASCENNGGATDECAGNAVETRIRGGAIYNIGSAQVNLISPGSCVGGGELYSIYPQDYDQECFWTNQLFAGWDKHAPGVTAYKTELIAQFECRSHTTEIVGFEVRAICTDWGTNRLQ